MAKKTTKTSGKSDAKKATSPSKTATVNAPVLKKGGMVKKKSGKC